MGSGIIERKVRYVYAIKNSDKESHGEQSGYLGHVIKIDEPNGQIVNLTGHNEIIKMMDIHFRKGEYVYDKKNYSMKEIKRGKAIYIGLSKDVPGNNWRELLTNIKNQPISSLEGEA